MVLKMSDTKFDLIEYGGPTSNRRANFARSQEDRVAQRDAAERFLVTGRTNNPDIDRVGPPYGDFWNRDYNIMPYPEAEPDTEKYDGTGIGFLYGLDSEASSGLRRMYSLDMAGWNLVREGVEVFRAETRVDAKELVPPEGMEGIYVS